MPGRANMEHEYTEGICGDGAAILRDGVMMPIEDIVGTLNALQAERDEARAALTRTTPGVVRIPEPTDEQYFRIFGATQVGRPWSKKETMERLLAWARTHAEVVVEAATELPELDPKERAQTPFSNGFVHGYEYARDRLRALQPQPPTTGGA
jgi:hypothetical protein